MADSKKGNTQTGAGGNNPQVQGDISTGSGGNINLGLQAERGGTVNTGNLVRGTVGNFNTGNQGNVMGNQVGDRDASSVTKGYGVGSWTQK
ncbi:hypothetical protein AAC387_Pa07g0186 [Persea americana]